MGMLQSLFLAIRHSVVEYCKLLQTWIFSRSDAGPVQNMDVAGEVKNELDAVSRDSSIETNGYTSCQVATESVGLLSAVQA
jgi:hypothetical protein